jgi:hypothetical protein
MLPEVRNVTNERKYYKPSSPSCHVSFLIFDPFNYASPKTALSSKTPEIIAPCGKVRD